MDAIILAGGLGTRLREVVSDVPKPLAQVRGVPFLDHLLKQLESCPSIKQIILAVGYQAEQIEEYYKSSSYLFSREHVPLGTGGALKAALMYATTEDVWVLNGDSYLDLSFEKMQEFHQEKKASTTMACIQVEDTGRYGSVDFKEEGRICAFHEKQGKKGVGWINGGVYLLRRSLLDSFPQRVFSLEKDVFPTLLNKNLFAYPVLGKFIDIGTKESYLQAENFFEDPACRTY